MDFYDLYVKWSSDRKQASLEDQKLQELLQESEYSTQVLNYSVYGDQLPSLGDLSLPKRVTIKQNIQYNLSKVETLNNYDLVSVRPQTAADFEFCCGCTHVDLISLRLHEPLGFHLRNDCIDQALRLGIMFEMCYASSIRDTNSRRFFVSNSAKLISTTASRNIVISSGTKDFYDQRAPYDVVNLGSVLGLTLDQSHKAITQNPKLALEHRKNQ